MTSIPSFGKRLTAIALAIAFSASEIAMAASIDPIKPVSGLVPLQAILRDPGFFEAPLEFVNLKEVHKGSNGIFIIHIQDAHANLSGQENLSGALDRIMVRYGVSVVLSEGGFQDSTLTPLKKIAPASVWKKIAKKYLLEGKISGEEYLNLTSDHPMKIIGIEDASLYLKSVANYGRLAAQREDILQYLKRIHSALEKVKGKLYPSDLLDYEKVSGGAIDHSRDKNSDLNIQALIALAVKKKLALDPYPNLARMVALQDKERAINFEAANLEQASLAEEIQKKGGQEGLQDFLKKAEALREKKLSQNAYFQNSFEMARERGIDLGRYPNLKLYGDYLKDFSEIDFDGLLGEVMRLEDALYAAVLTVDDQKLTRAIDRFINLLWVAYNIQMSTDEFALFNANEPDFGTVQSLAFLNRKLSELGYFEDLVPFGDCLEKGRVALQEFYDSVSRRDLAFLNNTEKELNSSGQKVAVLISGGYHTPHIKKLFREKGYSFAVLAPLVSSETNQRKYEKLLLAPLGKDGGRTLTVQGDRQGDKPLSALEKDLIKKKKKSNDGVKPVLISPARLSGARLAVQGDAEAVKELDRLERVTQGNFKGLFDEAIAEINSSRASDKQLSPAEVKSMWDAVASLIAPENPAAGPVTAVKAPVIQAPAAKAPVIQASAVQAPAAQAPVSRAATVSAETPGARLATITEQLSSLQSLRDARPGSAADYAAAYTNLKLQLDQARAAGSLDRANALTGIYLDEVRAMTERLLGGASFVLNKGGGRAPYRISAGQSLRAIETFEEGIRFLQTVEADIEARRDALTAELNGANLKQFPKKEAKLRKVVTDAKTLQETLDAEKALLEGGREMVGRMLGTASISFRKASGIAYNIASGPSLRSVETFQESLRVQEAIRAEVRDLKNKARQRLAAGLDNQPGDKTELLAAINAVGTLSDARALENTFRDKTREILTGLLGTDSFSFTRADGSRIRISGSEAGLRSITNFEEGASAIRQVEQSIKDLLGARLSGQTAAGDIHTDAEYAAAIRQRLAAAQNGLLDVSRANIGAATLEELRRLLVEQQPVEDGTTRVFLGTDAEFLASAYALMAQSAPATVHMISGESLMSLAESETLARSDVRAQMIGEVPKSETSTKHSTRFARWQDNALVYSTLFQVIMEGLKQSRSNKVYFEDAFVKILSDEIERSTIQKERVTDSREGRGGKRIAIFGWDTHPEAEALLRGEVEQGLFNKTLFAEFEKFYDNVLADRDSVAINDVAAIGAQPLLFYGVLEYLKGAVARRDSDPAAARVLSQVSPRILAGIAGKSIKVALFVDKAPDRDVVWRGSLRRDITLLATSNALSDLIETEKMQEKNPDFFRGVPDSPQYVPTSPTEQSRYLSKLVALTEYFAPRQVEAGSEWNLLMEGDWSINLDDYPEEAPSQAPAAIPVAIPVEESLAGIPMAIPIEEEIPWAVPVEVPFVANEALAPIADLAERLRANPSSGAFVFDLDGTLRKGEDVIDPQMAGFLADLLAAGVPVRIATYNFSDEAVRAVAGPLLLELGTRGQTALAGEGRLKILGMDREGYEKAKAEGRLRLKIAEVTFDETGAQKKPAILENEDWPDSRRKGKMIDYLIRTDRLTPENVAFVADDFGGMDRSALSVAGIHNVDVNPSSHGPIAVSVTLPGDVDGARDLLSVAADLLRPSAKQIAAARLATKAGVTYSSERNGKAWADLLTRLGRGSGPEDFDRVWKGTLRPVLVYLTTGQTARLPDGLRADPRFNSLSYPSGPELARIGEAVRDLWQQNGWEVYGNPNAHLAFLNSTVLPTAVFRESERRVSELIGTNPENRLVADWTKGVGLATHIQRVSPHLDQKGEAVFIDNELLVQSTRSFLAQYAAWLRTSDAAISPRKKLFLTWGLAVMLNPTNYDFAWSQYPETLRHVFEKWPDWAQKRSWLPGYYEQIFRDIPELDSYGRPTGKTLPVQRVERLLADVLQSPTVWTDNGLKDPTSRYGHLTVSDFLRPGVKAAPENEPTFSVALKDEGREFRGARDSFRSLLGWEEFASILPGLHAAAKAERPEGAGARLATSTASYPLNDIFETGVVDLDAEMRANAEIQAFNVKFQNAFAPFDARVNQALAEGRALTDAEKRSVLADLEAKFTATLAAEQGRPVESVDLAKELPFIQLTWLYNTYRSANDWKRMIDLYEKSGNAEFTGSNAMRADYLLALNRSGQSDVALEKLNVLFGELKRDGARIDEELFISFGTAYKNVAFVAFDLENYLASLRSAGAELGADQVERLSAALKTYNSMIRQLDPSLQILAGSENDAAALRALDLTGAIAKAAAAREKAFVKSNENYSDAYRIDLSHYAGINVIRTLQYQGKFEEAKKLEKLVFESSLKDDANKSFWVAATLLELSLLEGKRDQVIQALALTLKQLNQDGESQNLIDHFGRLAQLAPISPQRDLMISVRDILASYRDTVFNPPADGTTPVQRLENLRVSLPGEGGALLNGALGILQIPNDLDLSPLIDSVLIRLGLYRRGIVLPNNLRYGGLVPDLIVNRADREGVRLIVGYRPGVGDFDPDLNAVRTEGQGRALTDIKDFDEANVWADRFEEFVFGLRNPLTGERDLEHLDSARHGVFDDFSKKVKKYTGSDVSKIGATSAIVTAILGQGDCRPSNFLKPNILDEWTKVQQEPYQRAAFDAFRRGDEAAMAENIALSDGVERRETAVIQASVIGAIAGKAVYDIEKKEAEVKVGGVPRKVLLPVKADDERNVEEHTLTVEIRRNADGSVRALRLIDTWYQEFYEFGNKLIEGPDLESFLKTRKVTPEGKLEQQGDIVVSDSAQVVTRDGNVERIGVKLRPSRYSGPRQLATARRYDPDRFFLAGQPLDLDPVRDSKRLSGYLFNPAERSRIFDTIVTPIRGIAGARLSAVDGSAKELEDLIRQTNLVTLDFKSRKSATNPAGDLLKAAQVYLGALRFAESSPTQANFRAARERRDQAMAALPAMAFEKGVADSFRSFLSSADGVLAQILDGRQEKDLPAGQNPAEALAAFTAGTGQPLDALISGLDGYDPATVRMLTRARDAIRTLLNEILATSDYYLADADLSALRFDPATGAASVVRADAFKRSADLQGDLRYRDPEAAARKNNTLAEDLTYGAVKLERREATRIEAMSTPDAQIKYQSTISSQSSLDEHSMEAGNVADVTRVLFTDANGAVIDAAGKQGGGINIAGASYTLLNLLTARNMMTEVVETAVKLRGTEFESKWLPKILAVMDADVPVEQGGEPTLVSEFVKGVDPLIYIAEGFAGEKTGLGTTEERRAFIEKKFDELRADFTRVTGRYLSDLPVDNFRVRLNGDGTIQLLLLDFGIATAKDLGKNPFKDMNARIQTYLAVKQIAPESRIVIGMKNEWEETIGTAEAPVTFVKFDGKDIEYLVDGEEKTKKFGIAGVGKVDVVSAAGARLAGRQETTVASADQVRDDKTVRQFVDQFQRQDAFAAFMMVAGGALEMEKMPQGTQEKIYGFLDVLTDLAGFMKLGVGYGGTDWGVMKFVGKKREVAREQGKDFLLLAVTTAYSVANNLAPLDKNATHVVQVGDAKVEKKDDYLEATDAMFQIFGQIAAVVPSIAFLINGGPVTLLEAKKNIEQNRYVMVVKGSGRSADVVAALLEGKTDADILREFPASDTEALIAEARRIGVLEHRDLFRVVGLDSTQAEIKKALEEVFDTQKSEAHRRWQESYRANNPAENARWKVARESAEERARLEKELAAGVSTVRRGADGSLEIDILNRSYMQLTQNWKKENQAGFNDATAALNAALDAGVSLDALNAELPAALALLKGGEALRPDYAGRGAVQRAIFEAGRDMHAAWQDRNGYINIDTPDAKEQARRTSLRRGFDALDAGNQQSTLALLQVAIQVRRFGMGARLSTAAPTAPVQTLARELSPEQIDEVINHLRSESYFRSLPRKGEANYPAVAEFIRSLIADQGALVLYQKDVDIYKERTAHFHLILEGEVQLATNPDLKRFHEENQKKGVRDDAVPTTFDGPTFGRGQGVGTFSVAANFEEREHWGEMRTTQAVVALTLSARQYAELLTLTMPEVEKEENRLDDSFVAQLKDAGKFGLNSIRDYGEQPVDAAGRPVNADLARFPEGRMFYVRREREVNLAKKIQGQIDALDKQVADGKLSAEEALAKKQALTEKLNEANRRFESEFQKISQYDLIVKGKDGRFYGVKHPIQYGAKNASANQFLLQGDYLASVSDIQSGAKTQSRTLLSSTGEELSNTEFLAMARNLSIEPNPANVGDPNDVYLVKAPGEAMNSPKRGSPGRVTLKIIGPDGRESAPRAQDIPSHGVVDPKELRSLLGYGPDYRITVLSIDAPGAAVYRMNVKDYRADLEGSYRYSIDELIAQLANKNYVMDWKVIEALRLLFLQAEEKLREVRSADRTDLSMDIRVELIKLVQEYMTVDKGLSLRLSAEPLRIDEIGMVIARYVQDALKERGQTLTEKDDAYLKHYLDAPTDGLQVNVDNVVNVHRLQSRAVSQLTPEEKKKLGWRDIKHAFTYGADAYLASREVTGYTAIPLISGRHGEMQFPNQIGTFSDVVVVPDRHENIFGNQQELVALGIVDSNFNLNTEAMKGKTVVNMGDIFNRNVDTYGRDLQNLWIRLAYQAREWNSRHAPEDHIRVELILGNHELDLLRWNEAEMRLYFPNLGRRMLADEVKATLQGLVRDGILKLGYYFGNENAAADAQSHLNLFHAGLLPQVRSRLLKEIAEINRQAGVEKYSPDDKGLIDYANELLRRAVAEGEGFSHYIFGKSKLRGNKAADAPEFSGPVEADFGFWKADFSEAIRQLGLIDGDGKATEFRPDQLQPEVQDILKTLGILGADGRLLVARDEVLPALFRYSLAGHTFTGDRRVFRSAYFGAQDIAPISLLDGGDHQDNPQKERLYDPLGTFVIKNGVPYALFPTSRPKSEVPKSEPELYRWLDVRQGRAADPAIQAAMDKRAGRAAVRFTPFMTLKQSPAEVAAFGETYQRLNASLNKETRNASFAPRNIAALLENSAAETVAGSIGVSTGDFVVALEGRFEVRSASGDTSVVDADQNPGTVLSSPDAVTTVTPSGTAKVLRLAADKAAPLREDDSFDLFLKELPRAVVGARLATETMAPELMTYMNQILSLEVESAAARAHNEGWLKGKQASLA
ncbi:MAG TPA: hypothetical protein VL404_07930, partial [Candidatus Eisenbacteria bacterium]|nr:hypothetical protein [Candidatus Eisenbacteria bacterium]